MPLLPEYQDDLNPNDIVTSDDFFEALSSIKDENLDNLRNSTVDAPNQPILPQVKNPNHMADLLDEIEAEKQIKSERTTISEQWQTTSTKLKGQNNIIYAFVAYIAYKFFT